MSRFNSDLNIVPTQTVGSSPVIVDTTPLAVAKLAEAFTGQFYKEKALEEEAKAKRKAISDKNMLEANNNKALAGLSMDLLKIGRAADSGTMSANKAQLLQNQRISEFLSRSPELTEDGLKVFNQTRGITGLKDIATPAQRKAAVIKSTRDVGVKSGDLPADATDELVEEFIPILKKKNADAEKLRAEQEALERMDKNDERTKTKAKQIAVDGYRAAASVESQRVLLLTEELYREAQSGDPDSIASVTKRLFELKQSVYNKIDPKISSIFSQEEQDNMLSVVLRPIAAVESFLNGDLPAKTLTRKIAQYKNEDAVELLKNRDAVRLSTIHEHLGPNITLDIEKNNVVNEFLRQTQDGRTVSIPDSKMSSADRDLVNKTVDSLLSGSEVSANAFELSQEIIQSTLREAVSNHAQGDILTKPVKVEHIFNMLSNPKVKAALESGDIVLPDMLKDKANRVLEDVYISKLGPSVRNTMSAMAEVYGVPAGDIVKPVLKNGTLAFEINLPPEAVAEEARRKEILDNVTFVPFASSFQQHEGIEKSQLRERLDSLAISINKAANVASTINNLDQATVLEPLLRSLLGETVTKETPPVKESTESVTPLKEVTPEPAPVKEELPKSITKVVEKAGNLLSDEESAEIDVEITEQKLQKKIKPIVEEAVEANPSLKRAVEKHPALKKRVKAALTYIIGHENRSKWPNKAIEKERAGKDNEELVHPWVVKMHTSFLNVLEEATPEQLDAIVKEMDKGLFLG